MRQREPCNWKCTSSIAQRSIVSSRERPCSFFIFFLREGISIGDLRPRLAQAKSKLPEQTLALAHPQGDLPLLSDKLTESLSIPEIGTGFPVHRTASKSTADLFQLFGVESPRSARPVPLSQASKAFLFESLHPIGNCPRSISQERGNFCATQSLRNHQYTMQPVVVTRFIRAANLILQGQNDDFWFGEVDSFHSASRVAPINLFRNYLCRCV